MATTKKKTTTRPRTGARRYDLTRVAAGVKSRANHMDMLMIFAGASVYAVVPTVIGRLTGANMHGIRGVLTGLAAALALTGFGGRSWAVWGGALGAAASHLWWAKLNGRVVYPTIGTYLWRLDPTAKDMGLQPAPQSLGDASRIRNVELPGGRTIKVYTAPPAAKSVLPELPPARLAPQLPAQSAPAQMDAGSELSDFVSSLADGNEESAVYAEYDGFM
jgi:hypothetical protein